MTATDLAATDLAAAVIPLRTLPRVSTSQLALQSLEGPLPVCPVISAAAADVLTGSMTPTDALELAGTVLLDTADVDFVTVALTLRRPSPSEHWSHLGERAWLREWYAPGASCPVPASGPGQEEQVPALSWLSQHARSAGLMALVDTHLLGPDAAADRLELDGRNTRSLLSSMLRYDGVTFGSINLARARPGLWPRELAGGLRLISAAISARLMAERSQDALADALALAESTRSRQQHFFSSLGHELRTPIAAVIGTAELLGADLRDDGMDERAEDTDVILSAAEQLNAVVNDLITTAQVTGTSDAVEPVNVLHAVNDVAHWLNAPALAREIAVEVDIDTGAVVRTTPVALRQILTNLVGNAILYTHPGGQVRISSAVAVDATGAARTRVTVSDDGVGLSAQQQEDVFKPFVRFVDQGAPGTGLGLAISRTLAERYGALMGVESSPGQGCSFWVDLPDWVDLPEDAAA